MKLFVPRDKQDLRLRLASVLTGLAFILPVGIWDVLSAPLEWKVIGLSSLTAAILISTWCLGRFIWAMPICIGTMTLALSITALEVVRFFDDSFDSLLGIDALGLSLFSSAASLLVALLLHRLRQSSWSLQRE